MGGRGEERAEGRSPSTPGVIDAKGPVRAESDRSDEGALSSIKAIVTTPKHEHGR